MLHHVLNSLLTCVCKVNGLICEMSISSLDLVCGIKNI